MQRLISLFKEPEDPWPSLAEHPDDDEKRAHEEPLYFVELMAYLRERNRASASAVRKSPREGAD